MPDSSDERGTLALTEVHPAFKSAVQWLADQPLQNLYLWLESFSSVAIEGNRLAEVCAETLRRVMDREPVGDRYLLGLVWTMRFDEMPEKKS